MTLKIKPGVDLAKSFEKLKEAIEMAESYSSWVNGYEALHVGIKNHLRECTEETRSTENDIPNGLFETFGEIFNPNQPPKLD